MERWSPRGVQSRRRDFVSAATGGIALAAALVICGRLGRRSADSSAVTHRGQNDLSGSRIRRFPLEIRPGKALGAEHQLPLARLRRSLQRLQPSWEMFKIYKLAHAVELWGQSASFEVSPVRHADFHIPSYFKNSGEMVAVLLDARIHSRNSPHEDAVLFRSRHGVGVRTVPSRVGFEGALLHDDTLLSTLAEAGVSTERVIYVDGQAATVRDLVTHAMAEVTTSQELEWTLNAFARYLLPHCYQWRSARSGSLLSLDRLTLALLRRPLGVGSCYGIHALYTLTIMDRLDRNFDILRGETRLAIRDRLLTASDMIRLTQTSRGSWPAQWCKNVVIASDHRGMVSLHQPQFQELSATSHILEWLSVCGQDLRPAEAGIQRACEFFLNELEAQREEKIDFFYIQFTHGARGVSWLHGIHPADLIATSEQDLASRNFSATLAFE
jgi:hypothetical protein